ncbi:MAG TPA: helix-turn-helix domain-containing protein [Mycobacterium sp.]|nr:helix-turn-helix domain-containing protein [Mycobacterium sp.]
MGRKWTDRQFGKRLKAEREHRGWSQAEMAKMLSDNEIRVHPTTIAKIEAGDRSVRINEAFEIADLFGLSLDVLLGRATDLQSDLAYTLRGLLDTANQSAHQVWGISATLRERFTDVAALDFEGRETLQADGQRAFDALGEANTALTAVARFQLPAEASLRPIDPETARNRAAIEGLMREVLEEQVARNREGPRK